MSCGKLGKPHFEKQGWSFSRGESVNTRLSLVVPADNEGGPLGYSLERLMEWLCSDDTETIVVDHLALWSHSSLITLTKNRGKGAAVKAGAIWARGNAVAFVDTDMASDPRDLKSLINALDHSNVAVGSRDGALIP